VNAESVKGSIDQFQEYGITGLRRMGGYVYEEFLPQLQHNKKYAIYKEMSENDPTVNAILFAIEMFCRMVEWRIDAPTDDVKGTKNAKFVRSCMIDMSHTWADMISEVFSMLKFGFSTHEIVYKVRRGPDQDDPSLRSRYDDGMIGWRKIPIRSQESLVEWVFDDEGGVQGYFQRAYPDWALRYIPIEKTLLFRTTSQKNNPEGRALKLDTPIPTPDGWKTMGELKIGSRVFDEQGKIRYVTAEKVWINRKTYRVNFSDGSYIDADEKHEWLTQQQHERNNKINPKIHTTGYIANTIKTKAGFTNHSIPWANAVENTPQQLLLDPWYLGLWLGDGTSRTGDISCHADDEIETVRLIEEAGYIAKAEVNGNSSSNGRLIRVIGTRQLLRAMDLKLNKHVPKEYLLGSIQQRVDLLAGFMDSDGTVDKDGRCEFTNTNMQLVDSVAELVRSLGISAKVSLRKRANGISHKLDSYCVKFTPMFIPFRLQRKVDRCKPIRARQNHYIVSVNYIGNHDTKCIEVDSPSHMYLAGKSYIQTHNSILRGAYRPWYFKKRIEEIETIGTERDLAGLPMVTVPADMFNSKRTEDIASMKAMRTLVKQVRNDEQTGIVFPQAYDDDKNPLYKFELISTGGSRMFDTTTIIQRWDERIALVVLADFVFMGNTGGLGGRVGGRGGSYAMSINKSEMFKQAISAWLDTIAEVFNRHAIPRLFALNNLPQDSLPTLAHEDVTIPDLDTLGAFVQNMMNAGWADILSDKNLRAFLLNQAQLPLPESLTEGEMDWDEESALEDDSAKGTEDVVFAGPTGVVRIKPDGETEITTAPPPPMGGASEDDAPTPGGAKPGGPQGPAKSTRLNRPAQSQGVKKPPAGSKQTSTKLRRPNMNEKSTPTKKS
jgi:hypothetical protein